MAVACEWASAEGGPRGACVSDARESASIDDVSLSACGTLTGAAGPVL